MSTHLRFISLGDLLTIRGKTTLIMGFEFCRELFLCSCTSTARDTQGQDPHHAADYLVSLSRNKISGCPQYLKSKFLDAVARGSKLPCCAHTVLLCSQSELFHTKLLALDSHGASFVFALATRSSQLMIALPFPAANRTINFVLDTLRRRTLITPTTRDTLRVSDGDDTGRESDFGEWVELPAARIGKEKGDHYLAVMNALVANPEQVSSNNKSCRCLHRGTCRVLN